MRRRTSSEEVVLPIEVSDDVMSMRAKGSENRRLNRNKFANHLAAQLPPSHFL